MQQYIVIPQKDTIFLQNIPSHPQKDTISTKVNPQYPHSNRFLILRHLQGGAPQL